jgi:hypothetical protein
LESDAADILHGNILDRHIRNAVAVKHHDVREQFNRAVLLGGIPVAGVKIDLFILLLCTRFCHFLCTFILSCTRKRHFLCILSSSCTKFRHFLCIS